METTVFACSSGRLRLPFSRCEARDERVDPDALRLFLEHARQEAAERHQRRVSQVESQYLRHLQRCSTLPGASMSRLQGEKGDAAPVDDGEIIEIELEESDENNDDAEDRKNDEESKSWASCGFTSNFFTATTTDFTRALGKTSATQHLSPAPSTPQSQSNSQGISPEVYTPLISTPEEVSSTNATSAAKVSSLMRHDGANDTDAEVWRANAAPNSAAMFPNYGRGPEDYFGGMSVQKLCAENVAAQQARSLHTVDECGDQHDATRCLMHAFGRHLDVEFQQVEHDAPCSPPAGVSLEPELEEFLAWQAAKPLRRRERLQGALNCGSHLAKVYAAVYPELLSSALFDAPGKKLAEPLTPESPASRYIQWIASDVDCYEDLLLHLTSASKEVEQTLLEGVCEAALNAYITECVVDRILHNCK
ncbi:hypothetical protein C3747_211g40 [Trypanosoma cruzi]|uniref:Uncharacterized protein n=2 Tax=Trypanosoma cruzi TaxID=5693 RepID=Q4CUK3_TRYCC|nr:hypothetical protein, conserved [Trypanosoma cruzi]EAN83952.1 hypothetical protein, conserved [Trypanosoma cruzi]KAF5223766.1 hypothetical protein ECC02_003220 [Trypanosoma cruzi]PWV00011.1 hypothetical protein C3747_211g40 [Trypanosoma cruzi]RNC53330.1 hypothetical protein TcCL_ESM09354 [Trypanosoma cruzi]|eukprot:XP_805803.1 hypothetical protein [Trypanosoma cruzi strain CL Brener]